MKIAIQSDLHLEFNIDKLPYSFLSDDFDVLVLAGDISPVGHDEYEDHMKFLRSCTDKPIIYVPGNHDYYGTSISDGVCLSSIDQIMQEICERNSIFFLNNNEIVINDVSFFGTTLWSNLLYNTEGVEYGNMAERILATKMFSDYRAIDGWSNEKMLAQNDMSVKKLVDFFHKKMAQKQVVISHFCPIIECEHRRFGKSHKSPYFLNNLDALIDEYRPTAWIYGHSHDNIRLEKHGCQITCNQLGYPGEPVVEYIPNYTFEI